MLVKQAKFVTSAAAEHQFLRPEKPMIAVCGKSNAGKSTLINMLAGQKRLAKTSAAPGRTRLVNYFDFGAFMLADLPGYGYAAVSKEEQAKWEIAAELGLFDKVTSSGWKSLTSRESGRIGGILAARNKKENKKT